MRIELTERNCDIICVSVVAIVSVLFMLLIFNKFAMPSEGWYTVYADMILDGKVPYRDFEMVFAPLYTYIITYYVWLFGDNLMPLRIVGIFVMVGLTVVSYYVYNKMFPKWISAVAAITTLFVIQCETFVSYDYIRFYDLFNYITLLLLITTLIDIHNNKTDHLTLYLVLSGVFCAMALLFRQSTGLIILVFVIAFLIVSKYARNIDIKWKHIGLFILGNAIPFAILFIWLAIEGTVMSFFEMTVFAGSKGSFTDMMFNWIVRMMNGSSTVMFFGRYITINNTVWFIIMGVLAALYIWRIRKKDHGSIPEKKADMVLLAALAVSTVISLFVLYNSMSISSTVDNYFNNFVIQAYFFNFIIMVALFGYLLYRLINKEDLQLRWWIFLFFSCYIFCIGFGSGTSGGLSFGQTALNFGFIVCLVLDLINRSDRIKYINATKTVVITLVTLFIIVSISSKVIYPYQWWGLNESPYADACHLSDVQYFNGIYMTSEEKEMYEGFDDLCRIYLTEEDDIYCYAQVMVFYTLAHKIPCVKAPVCWFDVARDVTLREDLAMLKADNPKLIVFADHGESVIHEHESSFRGGETSGQRDVYNWLLECRDGPGSNYTVAATYYINEYPFYFMVLN